MTWIVEYIVLILLITVYGAEVKKARPIHDIKRTFNDYLDESSEIYKLYTRQKINGPVIPETCKHIGICDMVPNYPVDLVKKLIQEAYSNGTRFNQDTLETPGLATRALEYAEDIDLCSSMNRVFAPRAAQNEKNEWNFILNDFPSPVQTFRLEVCNQMNAPCLGMGAYNMGYRTRCVQKYILRKMFALNERNEIYLADFKVPSSCSCMVQHAYI